MATYYISPTGDGGADGSGTSGSPWKSWSHLDDLVAGDTLNVMDGTYTVSANGRFSVTAAGGHANGTDANRITVQAVNERAAILQGDGADATIHFNSRSYWDLRGLYVIQVDTNTPGGWRAFGAYIENFSTHIRLYRMLFYGTNRYHNTSCCTIEKSSNCLIEESEAYFFHRKGFSSGGSPEGANTNVVRRCYTNSLDCADIPGGYDTSGQSSSRGDEGITFAYPGSNNIVENCIAENSYIGFACIGQNTNVGNAWYGCIAHDCTFGWSSEARGTSLTFMVRDAVIENCLAHTTTSHAFYNRTPKNLNVQNCTTYNGLGGFVVDKQGASQQGDNAPTAFYTNCLAYDNSSVGMWIISQSDWGIDYCNSFSNATNYSPSSHANLTNSTTTDPSITTVRPWLPDASPMKGAGISTGTWTSGAPNTDKGANILYRYEDGVFTDTALWNLTTGAFPKGASVTFPTGAPVSGNNVTGTIHDIHTRLGVDPAFFPAGYGEGKPPAGFPEAPGFPSKSVLDTFDRSDGALGANWSALFGSGLTISSNVAVASGGTFTISRWETTYTEPAEAFFTLSALPAEDGAWNQIGIMTQDINNRYVVNIKRISGSNDLMQIVKVSGGGTSNLTSDIALTQDIAAGDKFGARVDGTTITMYWRPASEGVWYETGSAVDASMPTSGYITLGGGSTSSMNDFGGGGATTTPRRGRGRLR